MSREKYLDKTFSSNSYGDFVVIDYINYNNVLVRFINTEYECGTTTSQINSGEIKDKLAPSVYGVGIVGTNYPIQHQGSQTKEYVLWRNLLRRCYSNRFKVDCPTYHNCKASENFKSYTYFYEWCQKQIGFDNGGWGLDKDLLVKGNKTYSEHTCVFLPKEINSLLTKRDKLRGEYLIGVYYETNRSKFRAQVNLGNGSQKYIGHFNTQEEAFQAYKKAKEDYIKLVAEKWKDEIDPRAYDALMKYEVEIDD